MTPIINSYFNKHNMSWKLIHIHLLHPSDSVMKAIWRHQTITGLPKHWPKKLNKEPCTIFYILNMTNFPKENTFYTSNLQPGELIPMEFDFYNMNSILGFTYMTTVVCVNNIMIWLFPTASKYSPFYIIRYILTTLKIEQHPCKHVRVHEDGAL